MIPVPTGAAHTGVVAQLGRRMLVRIVPQKSDNHA